MPTATEFVEKCLEEAGDAYRFGAEVEPGTTADQTTEWDCSELVHVKLNELGIDAPDGSSAQMAWCEENGTIIPLEEGINTVGALLLRDGHVAVSLGNGQTIEAMGAEYGVGSFSATEGRTFTNAALVPGLDYGDGSESPIASMEPVSDEEAAYTEVPELVEKASTAFNEAVVNMSESSQSPRGARAGKDRRPEMKRGSKNGAVRFLQKKLKQLNHYTGVVDGEFGPMTEHAVRGFQKNMRIDQDGVVGKQTWSALGKFKRRVKRAFANKR